VCDEPTGGSRGQEGKSQAEIPFVRTLTIAQIRSGALNLLAERVPKISDEVRNTTKSCLIGDDEEYVQSGLKAFGALARTMVPGEENAFTELIPTVLPLIHSNSCNESAMDALSAIWYVLSMEMI
jgi:hypothetical protein